MSFGGVEGALHRYEMQQLIEGVTKTHFCPSAETPFGNAGASVSAGVFRLGHAPSLNMTGIYL